MTILEATLAGPADVAGWRRAAKSLRADRTPPERVSWRVEGEPRDLTATPYAPRDAPATAPPRFAALTDRMLLHRSPERFALAYRLFWRLMDEPRLMERVADPDLARASAFAVAVRRDMRRMRAFVRFRAATLPDGGEVFVAWFEPDHHIVEANAPFFVRRFGAMRWSIVTPERTTVWDGARLAFGPGGRREDVPAEDALEEVWRGYYAAIFNPARLNPAAMRAEMPKKYWRNLPEARAIPELTRSARARTAAMLGADDAQSWEAQVEDLFGPEDAPEPASLEELAAAEARCRRCPLWESATQAVPGAGRPGAPLMFVGEQPGDQEDLRGAPFVGPAGRLLDKALVEAGIDREDAFVTNAVKHFKFEQRGKLRLHKSPSTGEISQCRWWLDQERRLVGPKLLVALGASAAHGLLGKRPTISRVRGAAMEGPDGVPVFVTVHPSYLLRLRDRESKDREYARFVDDLRAAGRLAA